MGVSSDGVLYFGFQVGGEEEVPEWLEDVEDHDFENFLCEKAGLPENATWEDRKKVINACPADLYLFCSYEYPMYILGVRGAEYRAYRGDIVEINPESLFVDPDKIGKLKIWCEDNGIEWQEPKWLLCSMYG
jgi:hypothetical protein